MKLTEFADTDFVFVTTIEFKSPMNGSPVFKVYKQISTGHHFQVCEELMKYRRTLMPDEGSSYGEMLDLKI